MASAQLMLRLAVVLASLLFLDGCATQGNWLRSVEQPLYANQPTQALQALEQAGNNERNAALYLVHKGLLLRMAGEVEESIKAFEAAKPLITFQEATSISELAGSLTLTEGVGGYQPPAFEQIQLHFYQALNRLDLGDLEGARIEAMQIDILLERRWDGAAPHGADAAARFLTGLIFEANGEPDNALIAYRKAYGAYERASTVGGVPQELQRRLLMLTHENGLAEEFEALVEAFGEKRKDEALAALDMARDHGEVIVVASTGLVPHRYEQRVSHWDAASNRMVTVALPALSRPRHAIAGLTLRQSENTLARGEALADLAVLAQGTLDDEMPGLIARSVARNIVKAVGTNEAEEHFGAFGGFLVNVAGSVMEAADIRCWSTLPRHIQVVSSRVRPGTYTDLEIEYRGSNGLVAKEPIARDVRVAVGTPTVISAHRVSL